MLLYVCTGIQGQVFGIRCWRAMLVALDGGRCVTGTLRALSECQCFYQAENYDYLSNMERNLSKNRCDNPIRIQDRMDGYLLSILTH
jgi:hypothetical protein